MRRVGLLARDTTPVRLEFNALGVKLSSSSPDLGQAVETVEARYEGEDLTVAFNPQYLADGLDGRDRRDGAARRARRAEARRGARRGRRVHVPGDAGAAARGGELGRPGAQGFPRCACAWVELRDFRNHAYTRIEPVPDGLIVAVGPNGEGKTNLLEGMCYLFTLLVAAGQRVGAARARGRRGRVLAR